MPLPPDTVDEKPWFGHKNASSQQRKKRTTAAKRSRTEKSASTLPRLRLSFKTLGVMAICWSVGVIVCFLYVSSHMDELSEGDTRMSRLASAIDRKLNRNVDKKQSSLTPAASPLQGGEKQLRGSTENNRNLSASVTPAASPFQGTAALTAVPTTPTHVVQTTIALQTALPYDPNKPFSCRYEFHANMYIGDFANNDKIETQLLEAQQRCDSYGLLCKGVTCFDQSGSRCSTRRGDPPLAPSATAEVSYAKVCDNTPAPPSFFRPDMSGVSATLSLEEAAAFHRPPQSRNAAIVILEHNRAEYLSACLEELLKLEGAQFFAFYVSLDDPTAFLSMEATVKIFQHRRQIKIWKKPETLQPQGLGKTLPSENIGAHFGFALMNAFVNEGHEYAIFLEADLSVAPDFFTYFQNTMWLLEADPSLWCVSAWNDNGFAELVSDERRLLRTSYFPGLGWMIRNNTWAQLRNIWPLHPTTGWDHWIRHGSGNVDRECVMPEVPRTHHISTHGTNVRNKKTVNMYKRMALSRLPAGNLGDLSYLLKDRYEAELRKVLAGMTLFREPMPIQGLDRSKQYIVPFAIEEYKQIAVAYDLYPSNFRGHHNGMLLTKEPKSGTVVALIDRRKGGSYLPTNEAWIQKGQSIVVAEQGEHCNAACGKIQKSCNERDLVFINTCKVLQANFPCESGCGHEVGDEIPCHVSGTSGIKTAGMCLVSDIAPKCGAANKNTARLCVCL